jgi:hypothetical protein
MINIKNVVFSIIIVLLMMVNEAKAQNVSIDGISTYSTIGGNFRTKKSGCRTGFGFRCLSIKPIKVVFDVTISKKGTYFDKGTNNMVGVIRMIDENTAQLIVDKKIGISPDFYKEILEDGYFDIEEDEFLQQDVLDILEYKNQFPIKAGKYPVEQTEDYLVITLKKG